jgi:hypothetical protein
MKIAKALKMKNQLAGEVAQLKDLLAKQNSRSTKQKFDYDNREVLTRLRAKLDELVKVKTAVAAANVEIYDRIFRLAELKGLATTLNALDTKAGVFHEGRGFAEASYEESNDLLMLMPTCQTTSVSSFKMQAAARKAQAS